MDIRRSINEPSPAGNIFFSNFKTWKLNENKNIEIKPQTSRKWLEGVIQPPNKAIPQFATKKIQHWYMCTTISSSISISISGFVLFFGGGGGGIRGKICFFFFLQKYKKEFNLAE